MHVGQEMAGGSVEGGGARQQLAVLTANCCLLTFLNGLIRFLKVLIY